MIDTSKLILVHDTGWDDKRDDWLFQAVFSCPSTRDYDRLRILAKAVELTEDAEWVKDRKWGAVSYHQGDDGAIYIIYRSYAGDKGRRITVLATSMNYWVKSILELR